MSAALIVPALASAQGRVSLVKDINPGTEGCPFVCPGSAPRNLTRFHGELFFSANDGVHGNELWKSDGTRAGTKLVKDIHPGAEGSLTTYERGRGRARGIGRALLFKARDGRHGWGLWKSDGTRAGTKLVKAFGPDDPYWLTKGPGGRVFFFAGTGLWKSDGTRSGTKLVKSLKSLTHSPSAHEVTRAGRLLFFTTHFGDHFWRSDGTRDGTRRIKRVRSAGDFANLDGTLFFNADDRTHGDELWRSDGTRAGTKLVKDIIPGPESGDPGWLHTFSGKLFFKADDGVHGRELWKSNGTPGRTRLLKEIELGSRGSSAFAFQNVGRRFIFGASDSFTCRLWRSDGTRSGTKLIPIDVDCAYEPTEVAGKHYFMGRGGLWRSDGTRSGTKLAVRNVDELVRDARSFTGVGRILFFAGGYDPPGDELWKAVP